MRIAYLDCFSGISGDMFLGALIGAGLSPEELHSTVKALDLGARIEISQTDRSGISATKADVRAGGSQHGEAEHRHHGHEREKGHTHGRGLREIRGIIERASISQTTKKTSIAIFENLGQAEAKIHNRDLEKIHFHEVGAVDAMVDIVCAAAGVEALGLERIFCSPLNVGGGTVKCAHGIFPVPAPATVELLKGAPIYSSGIEAELVTPTGAAIVKTLVSGFGPFPAMKASQAGYGAGSRDFPGHANVLRLTIGEPAVDMAEDQVTVLEANLDDMNPQIVGYTIDRLFEAGALDVFATPVQMKKNRPGLLLSVLSPVELADTLARLVLTETTTLGVRRRSESRWTLKRRWESVGTAWGDIRIKIASMNGTVTHYAPEYEDCRKIAMEQGIPLKQVMQEAVQMYLRSQK